MVLFRHQTSTFLLVHVFNKLLPCLVLKNCGKLEKAEILEMTVQYLRALHSADFPRGREKGTSLDKSSFSPSLGCTFFFLLASARTVVTQMAPFSII